MMKNRLFLLLVSMIMVTGMSAQDWKSILGGIANKVEETVSGAVNGISFVGTWQYVKPDCRLKSDDLLSQVGGEVAAKKIEDEIASRLSKLGFNESTVYTFNEDSTYTSMVGGKTVSGTYSYNKDTKVITMKTRIGLKFDAQVSVSVLDGGSSMSLLFNADKLMSLANTVTGALSDKTSNSTISTVNSLLENYDGLLIGFEMQKK